MTTFLRAVLFDADGVLQHATDDLPQRLDEALGFVPDELDAFMAEVFAAEVPSLTGAVDLVDAVAPVVARWGAPGKAEALVAGWWCSIDVDAGVMSLVAELRARGVWCGLATNQQRHRARYMAETLGYDRLFDRSFYSCDLGFAKPDLRYFQTIADGMPFPPSQTLMIDDKQANVEAARAAGMQGLQFVHPRTSDAASLLQGALARFAFGQ